MRLDRRFRLVAHSEPRSPEHRQVVRAVADGDRLLDVDTGVVRHCPERVVLRPLDERARYLAGEASFLELELVGNDRVDGRLRPREHALDAAAEPARDDRGHDASVVQLLDQIARSGAQHDVLDARLDAFDREALQQRDALAETLGVLDLVVHRPLGDRRHLLGDAVLFAEQHAHLRVREGAVEVERDQFHTRPSARRVQNVRIRAARSAGETCQ